MEKERNTGIGKGAGNIAILRPAIHYSKKGKNGTEIEAKK